MSSQPTDREISAALERILQSPSFARARRSQEFLRYVTAQTLAGRADAISGYALGVQVFRKPADFDALSDPLVRVEAGRVRSRLGDYYSTAGAADPVRVVIERGGYVPTFSYVAAAQPPLAPRRQWWRASPPIIIGLAATAVLGVSGLFLANRYSAGERDGLGAGAVVGARVATAPRILVRPFGNSGEVQYLSLVFGLTEEIMSRLARYRDLQIYVAASHYPEGVESSAESSAGQDVDYVLTGSVRNATDTIRVSTRLIDVRSGRQVWTATFEESFDVKTVWGILDAIAGNVATTVGESYGPMFDAEVARVQGTAVENADTYHCVLRFLFALQVLSEDAHGRATACFEHVVATEPASSTSWARLATLYRMEYLHDFNPKADAAPALERALDAAQRALDLDFANAFAHQEMAFLSLLRDDSVGFEEEIARTLALNPTADVRAAIGVNFVKMGETERGVALIAQGMAESPRAPPFFFLGYVV